MRIFIQFAPKFREWPIAIMESIRDKHPESNFLGIATGLKNTHDILMESGSHLLEQLDWSNTLEEEWLSKPFDQARYVEYERRLGAETIKRILIADRQVGFGYVSCGKVAKTPLIKSVEDYENVKRYTLGLLDYVFNILESSKPDLVFCYAVAGSVALALAEVSRCLNIPFLRLSPTRVGKRYLLDTSPYGLLEPVKDIFLKSTDNPELIEKFIPQARKYIEEFRIKPVRPGYVEFRHEKFRSEQTLFSIVEFVYKRVKGLIKNRKKLRLSVLRYPSELGRFYFEVKRRLLARRLLKNNIFDSINSIKNDEYLYFPLHVDPEASTMVLAAKYTDQLAVIESISKALPLNMRLIVKEHLPMLAMRPKGFYERLKSIPGVVLLSPFEDGFSLLKNAKIVCVITGTTAFESALLKKSAIIIGEAPFGMLDKVFVKCKNIAEFETSILEAERKQVNYDEELERYLASIFKLSFDFPSDLLWGNVNSEIIDNNREILNTLVSGMLSFIGSSQRLSESE